MTSSSTSGVHRRLSIFVCILALVLAACQRTEAPTNSAPDTSQARTPVRVGWQVAWATQGQLALALQKTNALELARIDGRFQQFTYGAPLSEAALAGQLDVALLGDQPAINLLSKSPNWRIAARLMDFRVALVVPPNSPVKTVRDLKGRTLGIPFGASTHRFALKQLTDAGLQPDRDVQIVNIDIQEQNDVVRAGAGQSWKNVDAFATWDPHIANYEAKSLARVLASGNALGVIAMSSELLEKRPEDAARFLAAFKLAYLYYALHQAEADAWFAAVAGGNIDPAILRAVAAVEPNMRATSIGDVSIVITPEHADELQRAVDFALSQKLIQTPLDLPRAITNVSTDNVVDYGRLAAELRLK